MKNYMAGACRCQWVLRPPFGTRDDNNRYPGFERHEGEDSR